MLLPQLFIPILGTGLGITLGISLAIIIGAGIMPTLVEVAAKKLVQGIFWIINRNDPMVINKTNPNKYRAYIHPTFSTDDPELVLKYLEDNNATLRAMEKLYKKKQEIKENPEGWLDLSEEQKEQCTAINNALQYFRHHSFYGECVYRVTSEGRTSPLNSEKTNSNPQRFESSFLNNIIDDKLSLGA